VIYDWLFEHNIFDLEINSFKRFFLNDDIYINYLKFLSRMQTKGFRIQLHNGKDGLASNDETVRKETVSGICKDLERNHEYLDSDLLTLHPGPPCIDKEDAIRKYKYLRESLKPILEACEKANIKIVLENMRIMYPFPGQNASLKKLLGEKTFNSLGAETPIKAFPQLGSNISMLVDFIRNLESQNIGLCIDTGHAYISEGDHFYESLAACGQTLQHMHFCDNFGINDNHLPPGWADIDWIKVFSILKKISYKGICLLEITNTAYDETFKNLKGEEYTKNIFKVIEKSFSFMKEEGVKDNPVQPFCIKSEIPQERYININKRILE
jgi:sugar phosphate isomerase/epimerase